VLQKGKENKQLASWRTRGNANKKGFQAQLRMKHEAKAIKLPTNA
jgi:hypothetical protein